MTADHAEAALQDGLPRMLRIWRRAPGQWTAVSKTCRICQIFFLKC